MHTQAGSQFTHHEWIESVRAMSDAPPHTGADEEADAAGS